MALEDMVGGTFTISNGGVFGSLMGMVLVALPNLPKLTHKLQNAK